MSDLTPVLLAVVIGVIGVLVGTYLVRSSGANTSVGRRLAGARPIPLAELRDLASGDALPRGAVRIEGRVRCADPLITPEGDRLALLHRDIELQSPTGEWRVVERIRESRPIDLWERMVSIPVDLSRLAEPLVAIPIVWEGLPADLGPAQLPAVARLTADGDPPQRARSTTRQVSLVDRLIVMGHPSRSADGSVRLDPPLGGYLATTVELDVAMRLLAGGRRTRMVSGFALAGAGVLVLALAAAALLIGLAT